MHLLPAPQAHGEAEGAGEGAEGIGPVRKQWLQVTPGMGLSILMGGVSVRSECPEPFISQPEPGRPAVSGYH